MRRLDVALDRGMRCGRISGGDGRQQRRVALAGGAKRGLRARHDCQDLAQLGLDRGLGGDQAAAAGRLGDRLVEPAVGQPVDGEGVDGGVRSGGSNAANPAPNNFASA